MNIECSIYIYTSIANIFIRRWRAVRPTFSTDSTRTSTGRRNITRGKGVNLTLSSYKKKNGILLVYGRISTRTLECRAGGVLVFSRLRGLSTSPTDGQCRPRRVSRPPDVGARRKTENGRAFTARRVTDTCKRIKIRFVRRSVKTRYERARSDPSFTRVLSCTRINTRADVLRVCVRGQDLGRVVVGVQKMRDEGRNTIIYAACDVHTRVHTYIYVLRSAVVTVRRKKHD